ncbi:P27 family phage terminase small subunit [Bacillus sp. AFS017336]|uniref:P27 family phage terminase small subunit n=1 Tax=Bacillus sp. AFS017336 TaxID=2033489 RepID=UPI000BF15267|nr:P27 family phage terminase small subunit [Bacillus sp. AFS017336]PEL13780.1 hypothetical protein CN601_03450 [Bacillus sp. AFS017336]
MVKLKTKKQIENKIIKDMKNMGTYKKEYNQLIEIYAGMLHQYISFEIQFEESNYQVEEEYTNKAGATNMRKVPLYTAMESLRKDIASYSDRLTLNPKSLNVEPPKQQEQSVLAQFLAKQG